MLPSVPSRYVSNIDKIIDEAPSDPTQDFKTQVWVSAAVWLVYELLYYLPSFTNSQNLFFAHVAEF